MIRNMTMSVGALCMIAAVGGGASVGHANYSDYSAKHEKEQAQKAQKMARVFEQTALHNKNPLIINDYEDKIAIYKDGKTQSYTVNGDAGALIDNHYKLTDKTPCKALKAKELVVCRVDLSDDYDAISLVPYG